MSIMEGIVWFLVFGFLGYFCALFVYGYYMVVVKKVKVKL